MRALARMIGLAVCLLVLLTTCSAPFADKREPRISGFVARPGQGTSAGPAPNMPTVQPSVTPAPAAFEQQVAQTDNVELPAAVAPTPGLVVPTVAPAPLSAAMLPAAPAPLSPELATRAAQMDAYMHNISAVGYFRGAVLVAWRGQVLLAQGYGPANQALGLENSAATRFRLASVSKPLTALAVMQLVASGDVDLNASICAYLNGCAAAWGPISVRHLLTHTSGLANYTDFASFAELETQPASVEQVVARFRDLPLGFAPGEAYQYCNSNYVLLGQLIEEVSGQPFAETLRTQIFAPLSMADSGYDSGNGAALNGTQGYASPVAPAIPLDTSNLFAAGGIYSTVLDLYRLSQALDVGTLLPAELAAQAYTPLYYGYGYGWKIEERHGRRVFYHPGNMSGAATYFGRYPDEGLTVIVLSNLETVDAIGTADYLAGIAFN